MPSSSLVEVEVGVEVRSKLYQQVFYFCGRVGGLVAEAMWWVGCGGYVVGGGGVEKWRLKLTSAKVEVEVEAELGNFHNINKT